MLIVIFTIQMTQDNKILTNRYPKKTNTFYRTHPNATQNTKTDRKPRQIFEHQVVYLILLSKDAFQKEKKFQRTCLFIILSRDSDKYIKQSYKYEISSRCKNYFCLVSIEIRKMNIQILGKILQDRHMNKLQKTIPNSNFEKCE